MNKAALSVLGALCLSVAAVPSPARACGGLVSSDGTLGSDAQRAFYAVRDDRTELVVQLYVPQGGKGYGALLPVPVQPTLDPTPVAAADLDALEADTRPRIIDTTVSGGGGIGCGSAASDRALGGASNGGVIVGDTVAIGPLTAVSLSAQDGTALATWLGQNGFTLPAAAQRVADGYAGPGRWFVALKRNDTPTSRSSIGVHLTLPGDQRGFALRMAGISVATKASFTIFVAAPAGVAPALPFSGVTLTALDRTLAQQSYAAAVEQAVQARKGRAFVLEGVFNSTALPASLAALTKPGSKVTRLSTVLQAADLSEDVAFTAAAPESVPVVLAAAPRLLSMAGTGTASGPLTLAALAALCAVAWSRRASSGRRRSDAPAAP